MSTPDNSQKEPLLIERYIIGPNGEMSVESGPGPTPPATALNLERLKELEAKATRGPWEIGLVTNDVSFISAGAKTLARLDDEGYQENVAFIVALRNAFPALLAHIRELEAENVRLLRGYGEACSQYVDLAQLLDCNTCDVYKKAVDLRAQLTTTQADVQDALNLISTAKCPDCDGSGAYLSANSRTGEPELQQCFWCAMQRVFIECHRAAPTEGGAK